VTTNYFPGNLQWLGLAKETTYGIPAASPTAFVPMVSPKWQPNPTTLVDDGLRGSMAKAFGLQQGLRFDEITYSTYPYMDSIYPHLLAILGNADTLTGASDPYTHKTSLYNGSGTNAAQPPSYTLWYFDAAGKCWQMAGAMAKSMKIDVKAEALVSVAADWIGLPATAVTPPSNTPTANPPMPSWNSVITVGGSALTKYSEVSLSYSRATEMIPTLTGTQVPVAIYCGELDVTGSLQAVYQGSTDNDLASFIANTQPALLVKILPAGDATHSLTLQHSKVAYTASAPSGTNKWMEIASSVQAIANATDALGGGFSPAQAIFLTAASAAF
jgi:hypothetical protein